MRALYAADPAKFTERGRAWRAANPDRAKACANARYAQNRERIRQQKLTRTFGLGPNEYERMLAEQSGLCAICSLPPGETALAVDHDHETGAVRGLLCSRCNMALGGFRDSPEILTAALEYLK